MYCKCKFFNVSNVLVKTLVTELVETMHYLDYSRKRWFRMRVLFGDVMLAGANCCRVLVKAGLKG